MHVPLAYFLSRAAGRPVRLVLEYAEDMQAGDPRHPSWVTIRTGLRHDGTILARTVKAVFGEERTRGSSRSPTPSWPAATTCTARTAFPTTYMRA